MTKSRVEVNEEGDFFLVIPDDIVAEAGLDDGDLLELEVDDGFIFLSFA
jgi:bifunctional DNA-binding transcriptional regulator/antitoxin component of YhaV-PrlF toxin-antitoxin module